MSDVRKCQETEVKVHTIDCDWNNLAWQTIVNLTGIEEPPLPEEAIEGVLRHILSQDFQWGCVYVNPGYIVNANRASQDFLLSAKRARSSWLRQQRQILGNTGFRSQCRQATPLMRSLQFTGLLFLDGRHVRNDRWPFVIELPSVSMLLDGQTFGRLTVLTVEQRGCCLCRCTCGKEIRVQRRHLVSGRTKSCGCLRAEMDARIQNRKQKRAWIGTGLIG